MSGHEPIVAHINLARGYRGGERQTQLLIESLQEIGWRQILVARRDELLAQQCEHITGLDLRAVAGNVISGAAALHDAELVHVHEGRSVLSGYLNWRRRRTPYLVTRRIQLNPSNTSLNRIAYRSASGICAVSEAIGHSLGQLIGQRTVSIIPDATSELKLNIGKAASLRSSFGSGFVVGHVGALDDSHKGQLQIIELARRASAAGSDLIFVLVGSGRDEQMLRDAGRGLPNLHFMGFVDDVGSYLAAFDVFLYPSRHEGLGSILLDALDFGLPIVATAVGGIPEIIEDKANGFLCAVDDLDAMLAALHELRDDPELAREISATNRESANNYSPQKMAESYSSVYRQMHQATA